MGRDYPTTQVEFEKRFATEDACRRHIAQLRCPDGFAHPQCQAKSARSATRLRWICRSRRYQAAAASGTIFEGTRKPLLLQLPSLRTWLQDLPEAECHNPNVGASGKSSCVTL